MECGHESNASVGNGENVENDEGNPVSSNPVSLLDHLDYCKSSNQLKWRSNSDNLVDFLSTQMNTSKDSIGISCNGSCSVFKLPSATFNFYHNTKTLQVQGRESARVKESLINLISTRSAETVKPDSEAQTASATTFEERTVDESSNVLLINDTTKETTIIVGNNTDSESESDSEESESDQESDDEEEQGKVLTEIAKVWDAVKDIKQIISSKENIKTAEQIELEQAKSRILQLEHENRSLLEVIRLMSSQNSYLPQFCQSPFVLPNERKERDQVNSSRVNDDDNPHDNGTNEQLRTTKKRKKRKRKQKTINTTNTENQNNPPLRTDAQPEAPKKSKPSVVIAGDSMVKYINGWKVCPHNSSTQVKSFPGATVNDMSHYIKPSLERKPDEIILHVGTNDIKFKEAREIAEKVVDLGREIQNESPDTKVTISSIINRSDDSLNSKIKEVNKIVAKFAKQNHWTFLSNANINKGHLNSRGLHLNPEGTKILASNFISHIKKIYSRQ